MSDTTETVMQQPPTEFGEYNFPSRDRIELYGNDQLVHVFWEGSVFIVGPACFRVPRAIPWSEFVSDVVGPWAEADPAYDPAKVGHWRIDDTPIDPKPADTLEGLGVEHKGLLKFRCDNGQTTHAGLLYHKSSNSH